MPLVREEDVLRLKEFVDLHLPKEDGFESHLFQLGDYNDAVSSDFHLAVDPRAIGLMILSTPAMFDVSFRRWVGEKCLEFGSIDKLAEEITSPIQEFMADRLEPVLENLKVPFQLFHDHSLWPSRRPKILMQTCGHVSGAAFYYQPQHLVTEDWPPNGVMDKNSKFIGLSLHPVYGGHFAFRSVLIFPETQVEELAVARPQSILKTDEEARQALEKFNFSWRDSGFRDFGSPKQRYSQTQVEFFGKPPAERWQVLRMWFPDL